MLRCLKKETRGEAKYTILHKSAGEAKGGTQAVMHSPCSRFRVQSTIAAISLSFIALLCVLEGSYRCVLWVSDCVGLKPSRGKIQEVVV